MAYLLKSSVLLQCLVLRVSSRVFDQAFRFAASVLSYVW